jgi:hypothetical protein
MKNKINLVLIVLIGFLLLSLGLMAEKQIISKDSFLGDWIYESNTEKLQIKILKVGTNYKGSFSIAAESGNKLDVPFDNNDFNMIIGNYSNSVLNIVLNSSFSSAKYNAKLRYIDANTIEFELGSAIVNDIHFFPGKKIELRNKVFTNPKVAPDPSNPTGDPDYK